MLQGCGALGLDWNELSASGYLEAIEAHNEMQDGGGAPGPSDWLRERVNGTLN